MARKKSGGFNKILEFIGLVDDGEPRDAYEDEYESGNYGRAQTYTPQRNVTREPERSRAQQPLSRRYNSDYQPTRAPRMNRSGSASRFDEPRPASRRPESSGSGYSYRNNPAPAARTSRYDYSPRPSRFDSASRFDDVPAANSLVPQQRNSSRQRTVMFSLHNLEDCCDVIDNLILSNTVVLTLNDLDPSLIQRAVDTLSGAVFALHATIRKASELTYLIAPMSVEVNADEDFGLDRRL